LGRCPNFDPKALTEIKKHFEEYTYTNWWLDVLKNIPETQRKMEARRGTNRKKLIKRLENQTSSGSNIGRRYEISAQQNSTWEGIPDPPISTHNPTKNFSTNPNSN
jgi:hypothetical protein